VRIVTKKANPVHDYIDIGLLELDRAYQRILNSSWVKGLVETWDDGALGMLCVSLRADGKYYIIDGQHRFFAALALGVEFLPCEIWTGLLPSDEARMFVERNTRRTVPAFAKFRAAVEAGAPDQCEIQKIVEAAGWRLAEEGGDGKIRAVAALERAYGANGKDEVRHPDRLRTTLEILHRAWGYDRDAVAGHLVDGLWRVVGRYGDELDHDTLIRKLAKYSGGPLALIGRAKELRSFINTSVPNAVAEIVVEAYNRGLRTTQLPGWRS
jgi:hypothetical protein